MKLKLHAFVSRRRACGARTNEMGADDAVMRARACAYAAGVAVGAFVVVVAWARPRFGDADANDAWRRSVTKRWSRGASVASSRSESMSSRNESPSSVRTRRMTRGDDDADDVDDGLRERFEECARRFAAGDAYVDPKVKARLYGLYKRSTKNFERDATRLMNPLDAVGWIKYEAWANARALSRGEAMRAYVETFTNWELERGRATEADDDGFTEMDRLAAMEFYAEEEEETSTVNDGERVVYGGAWSQMEKRQSQPVVEDHSAWSEEEEPTTSVPDGKLIEACKLGDVDAAMAVIQNGADVNERDAFGRTPMHWCADGGHSKLAMNLAVLKAEINVQDKYGQTPLHFSVNLDDVDMINTLLDWGADPNIADDDGETPESLGIWGIVSEEEDAEDEDE